MKSPRQSDDMAWNVWRKVCCEPKRQNENRD